MVMAATVALLLQVLQTGDVIAFYNSVFVPAVKTDLLRINQDRATLPAPPAAEGLIGESPVRRYNRSVALLNMLLHPDSRKDCGLKPWFTAWLM